MAEEYIIGSNAQFNDSVEILKDLTLYGVVENSTDFAVKIQGDEKLRITSDNFSFKIQGNDKLNIGNDNISFKTGFNIKIPNSYDVDDDGDIDVRDALYFGRGQFPSSVAIENSVQNAGIFFGDGDILRETTGSPQYSGSFALFTRNSTYDYADNFVSGTPAGGIRVGYSTAGTSGGSGGFSIIATKHDGNGTPVTMLQMGSDNLIFSGKVLIKGHTTNVGQIETQLAPSTQLYGNDRKGGIRIADFSDSPYSASLQFVKSRAGTVGVNTILQDGDRMGSIYWGGANGTNYQPGAFLTAITDGTVSSTLMPTAISFGTNEGNNLVERLRINPDGMVTFSGTNAQDIIHISTGNLSSSTFGNIRGDNKAGIRIRGGGSYGGGMIELAGGLRDTDPAVIKFHTGTDVTANNDEHMRITSTGQVLINRASSINSQAYLEVQGGATQGQTNYIQTWRGDSDNLALRNQAAGDYEFTNSQQGNQVAIYDGTGGARLEYADGGNFIGMNNNIAFSNRIDSLTTSGGSNVRVSSGGELRKQSSSRRFKDNIREYIGVGVSAIKQIVPKLWEDHAGEGTKLGFIAEEIHDLGLTNAVIYDPYIGGSEIGIGITYGDSYGNGSTPVTKTGETLDDEVLVVGGLDEMSLIAELVIAVKQLTARIETLESGG